MSSGGNFKGYDLHHRVLEAVEKLGFKKPTSVQEKVIPLFLQKRNLVVEAPTGTGKTAAYGLPLISRLDLLKKSTQALVMVPSRELAIQIQTMLQSFFEGTQLKVAAVYGGVTMEESFTELKSGAQIMVVVPGRLRDLMFQYQWDYLWRDIRFLIIDEGDKLLEQGFQRDFDEIRQHVRGTAQTGFFSATISADAEAMIKERFSPVQVVRLKPKELLKKHTFFEIRADKGKREAYLMGLIEQKRVHKALIFAGRREAVITLTGFLRNCGFRAESFYGNQNQQERDQILKRFKEGHIDYLVGSDLAARGIDIPALPAVINLSMSEEYDFYLHRVGRTGRAGSKGTVFNIMVSELEHIRLKNHHRLMQLPLKTMKVDPIAKAKVVAAEEDKWTKFHFARGKQDKIRKGDIVGFLTGEVGVPVDDIGTITVYDSYSIVDLPNRSYTALKNMPQPIKIKGKSLKIRKYTVTEQENRAKAAHKLKKDRTKRKPREEAPKRSKKR